jgi:hypothetical protein
VDARYQRPLDEKRANKIAKEFAWDQFGVLEVSERTGGFYAVFDGQHRLMAATKLQIMSVPCLIHRNLSPEQEAVLFTLLQTQRQGLSQVDRFRAKLFAGDTVANEIAESLARFDYAMGKDKGSSRLISAVAGIERVYTRFGRDHLEGALAEVRGLWGHDKGTAHGKIIEGMAHLLAGYGDGRYGDKQRDNLRVIAPAVIIRRADAVHAGDQRPALAVYAELRKAAKVNGRPRTFKKVKAAA